MNTLTYQFKSPHPFSPMPNPSQTRFLHHLPSPLLSGEPLVPTAVSILNSRNRKSRFNHLDAILPPSGLSPSQSSSIILALRNNPRLALRFFLRSRARSPSPPTLQSYSTIIHTLARARRKTQTLILLRDAIRSHPTTPPSSLLQTLTRTYRTCDSAPFIFDLLIQAYLHSNNLDSALSILRSLRSKGIHPSTFTANSLLKSTANLRGSEIAINLYRDIVGTGFRPNSQTFNELLLAVYREEKMGLNGEILTEMERFECNPNALTYSILIAGCGEIDGARRLWGEMRGRGIEPDVAAYNTMVRCCCEAGETKEGEELCREMGDRGLVTSGTTLEVLIRGHCMVGDVEKAVEVCGDMRRKGIGVGEEIVDGIVEGMCEKGRVDEGLGFLRGQMGGRRSYEAIIRGFCESGRMEEAAELQGEMAGKGLEAGERVYEAFVCGYERAGEVEMVERLRKEMVGCVLC